jgi:hypothetical protein
VISSGRVGHADFVRCPTEDEATFVLPIFAPHARLTISTIDFEPLTRLSSESTQPDTPAEIGEGDHAAMVLLTRLSLLRPNKKREDGPLMAEAASELTFADEGGGCTLLKDKGVWAVRASPSCSEDRHFERDRTLTTRLILDRLDHQMSEFR